jgi:hypothetical protein|tara:strand:- start:452 stop:838 length:387 start_codon:yes stop_codon:yes gene_type:complete
MQNLQTFDSARDWDQIEAYASSISGALVYWENPRLEVADDSAKSIVVDYYKLDEEVPPELILLMESKYYGYIEFRNADVAFDFVTDYFPRKDEVDDDTYWYQCFVVRPDGVIEYENNALRAGNNRPKE